MLGLFSAYRHAKAVRDLQDAIDDHDRRLKKAEQAFEDLYDYVMRAMGRISKRAALIEKHEQEQEPEPPEEAAEPAVNGQYLTPRQRTLQQQILGRRGPRRTE